MRHAGLEDNDAAENARLSAISSAPTALFWNAAEQCEQVWFCSQACLEACLQEGCSHEWHQPGQNGCPPCSSNNSEGGDMQDNPCDLKPPEVK